jgi:hypothetical protein
MRVGKKEHKGKFVWRFMMKIGKTLAWIGLFAMTAALMNGFINGNFTKDGSELLANPWGIVSMVDLYVGFTLFSMWIAFREKSSVTSIVWIVLMMTLGFFAGSLYVLLTLYKSKGDWLTFFLGSRKALLISK